MKKFNFAVQLEHTAFSGWHGRRWVVSVGSVQDKQYKRSCMKKKKSNVLFIDIQKLEL